LHVSVSFSGVANSGQFDDSVRHGENVENNNDTLYDVENTADAPSVGEIREKKDGVDNHQKKSRINAIRCWLSACRRVVRMMWKVIYTEVNSNIDTAKNKVHCNRAIHDGK